MTIDITTIGIGFDTSGLNAGQQSLNATTQAANNTANAADRVGATGSRNFNQFGNSAALAERQTRLLSETTSTLSRVMGMAAAAFGGMQIVQMIDQYAKFTAQLKLATVSTSEYVSALADVRRIAKEAHADLSATGVLYARIANGTRELGVSQKKVAEITETVNLALKVSGATFAESSSAMLQLSQAFASGTLRGEEFNAVNEAAPRLMKALADGIGVPVGALKSMASEGKITSEIMANVLPNALKELREEAKNVQTIGGAFTVLKNSVMEFVGTTAEANGTVKIIASAFTTLADNLGLVAAAATGLVVTKLAEMLASVGVAAVQGATSVLAYAEAQTVQRAAGIASAQAEIAAAVATGERMALTQAAIVTSRQAAVSDLALANASVAAATAQINAARAAGAQSYALAMLAQGEAALVVAMQARSAATAELALLGQQQARVSAQITAANAAQAASQVALTAATAAGGAASGLATRALAMLGGPIGAISILLGVGVAAWMAWGNNAKESSEKAAESFGEKHQRILDGLDKEIQKLERRNELHEKGLGGYAKQPSETTDQLAEVVKKLEQAKKGEGEYKNDDIITRQEKMRALGQQYADLTTKIERKTAAEQKDALHGKAANDLIEVRQRLSGVNKQYLEDLTKLEAARDKGVIGEKEYIKLIGQLATETYNKSKAGKEAAKTTAEESNAYDSIIRRMMERSQALDEELRTTKASSASDKIYIDLKTRLADGTARATKAELEYARALNISNQAKEVLSAGIKGDLAKYEKETQDRAKQGLDVFNNQVLTYGRMAEAASAYTLSVKQGIDLSNLEVSLMGRSVSERETIIAQYKIEIDLQKKIQDIKKQNLFLVDQEDLINKATATAAVEKSAAAVKAQRTEWIGYLDTIERTAHDTFVSIANGSKDFATRLRETLKNGFFDWLWQMTAKKWIVNIGASMSGSIASGAANAVGAAGAASGGLSLVSMIGAGANAISAAGSMFGASAVSAFGGGIAATIGADTGLAAMYASAATAGNLSAGAAAGGAVGSGIGSIGAALGAIPVWGWAAMAAAAVAVLGQGKDRELTGVGLSGQLGTQNITRDVSWTKDGGWFNSDTAGTWKYNLANSSTVVDGRNYTDTASQTTDKALLITITKEYDALKLAAGDYAKALGLSADFLKDRTQDFSIELGTTAEEMQKNIAKLFEKVGNDISTDLLDRAGLTNLKKDGETASQTVSRLATDISAVNEAMKVLGYETYKLNASGIKAAEGLVTLYGGLQQMQSITSGYYDKYYSDAEKASIATANISAEFKKIGSDMPTSLGQLREWIEAAKALGTEAGDKTYVSLMQLTGAFASLNEATANIRDTATQKANTLAASKSDYILQIMEAQGLGQQALNLKRQTEIMLLDAELRPLAEKLELALREKEARELATRQAGLAVEILRLEGKGVEATALQRKLELAAMEAGLRPQQLRIYGLQDEASQLEILKGHRALDIELMRALGNEEGALAAERADALKGLDEYSKAIKQQTWAANDAKAAIEKAKASAQAEAQRIQQEQERARQEYESAYSKAQSNLSSAYQKRAGELQTLIDKMSSFGKAALDMRDSLIYGANSTLGTEAKYLRAKGNLGELTARANAQDASALTELQQFIELSRAYNASNGVFVEEFGTVQSILEKAGRTAMSQADVAKAQLTALNQSVTGLIDLKDATTDSAKAVVDAINALLQVTLGNVNAANAANAVKNGGITTTAAPTPDQIYGGKPGEGNLQAKRAAAMALNNQRTAEVDSYIQSQYALEVGYNPGSKGNQYYMDLNEKFFGSGAFEKFARELGIFAPSDMPIDSKLPKFAGGGVFTNGIVTQPTTFNFGEMGEAGPEAIVPITQGPKGLGIRSYGGASKGSNKEAIELAKRQVTEAERNNDLLEKQNELLEKILTSTDENASSVDIRELKQYMGATLSLKARAPA